MRVNFPNITAKNLLAIYVALLIFASEGIAAYTLWSDDFSTDFGWNGYGVWPYSAEWQREPAVISVVAMEVPKIQV